MADELSIQNRLFEMIEKHRSPELPITLSTSIQTDLGLDGEEARNLVQEISHEFSVDLSEIDSRYLVDEFMISLGMALFIFTPLVWAGMYCTGKGKKTELLVGDLLRAAETKHWQHPNRPAKYPWQRRKNANKFE